MSEQRERIVIELDGSGVVTGVQQVTGALNTVGRTADKTDRDIRRVGTAADSAGKSLGSMATGLKGLVAGMATGTVAAFAKSVIDAGIAADSLQRSLVAISGSQSGAADAIAFLRKEADRLGQSFYDIAPSFKSIAAAARGTALEGEPIRKVFSAITEASAVLGLSAEATSGALGALGQMISKGSVQAEELRGQLGERLPGAFNLAAKAMGVTTAELGDMLEKGQILASDLLPKLATELHKAYGAAAEISALESGQAAINRLSQSWEDLKATLYNSSAIVDGINAVVGATNGLTSALNTVLTPFGKFYTMVDNIDEAISRVGQGRLSLADFATMNGQELADALRESQENTAKELRTVENNLDQAIRDKLSSDAAKKADALRDTYKVLVEKQIAYINAQSSRFAPGTGKANELAKQIVDLEEKAKQLGVELTRAGATDQFLLMRQGLAGADAQAQKLASSAKKANDELSKLTQTNRQKVNAKADELKRNGADPAMVEKYRSTELAKIAEQEASASKRANSGAEREAKNRQRAHEEMLDDGKAAAATLDKYWQDYEDRRVAAVAESYEAQRRYTADELQLQTEFADKFKQVVLGDTGYKVAQIESMAEAYRKAGSDEVAVAQWAAQEKLNASDRWQDGAVRGLRAYADEAGNAAKSMESAMTNAFSSMEDAMVEFATTGKLTVGDMVNTISADLARLAIRQNITQPLASGLGGVLQQLLSGVASPSVASVSAPKVGYAVGGVLESAGLSAYSSTIVDRPTLFPFARGMGLMGEAGPEAIMPLKRGADGKLGVQASGASSPMNVRVEMINQGTPQQVQSVTPTFDAEGMILKVITADLSRNGPVARAMTGTYNLRRAV